MSPVAPRTVGLVVALAASVAAAAGLAAGALLRPFTRPPARANGFGIHRVPARPPLWDARPSTGPMRAVGDPRDAAPVPPENNHARWS